MTVEEIKTIAKDAGLNLPDEGAEFILREAKALPDKLPSLKQIDYKDLMVGEPTPRRLLLGSSLLDNALKIYLERNFSPLISATGTDDEVQRILAAQLNLLTTYTKVLEGIAARALGTAEEPAVEPEKTVGGGLNWTPLEKDTGQRMVTMCACSVCGKGIETDKIAAYVEEGQPICSACNAEILSEKGKGDERADEQNE